jgi:hypothetical protein
MPLVGSQKKRGGGGGALMLAMPCPHAVLRLHSLSQSPWFHEPRTESIRINPQVAVGIKTESSSLHCCRSSALLRTCIHYDGMFSWPGTALNLNWSLKPPHHDTSTEDESTARTSSSFERTPCKIWTKFVRFISHTSGAEQKSQSRRVHARWEMASSNASECWSNRTWYCLSLFVVACGVHTSVLAR